jgi:hypothetical protein
MDTTTKMFVIAAKDKEFAKILSVVLDFYTNEVDEKTVQKARDIENEFIEYWQGSTWIRFVAGICGKPDEWHTKYGIEMIEEEFNEKEKVNE